jgi:L-asparagine transporter-like permease
MKWPHIILFPILGILLVSRFVLERNLRIKYPYGRVSVLLLCLMVLLFACSVVTAIMYRVDYFDYDLWPNWHRALVLTAVLTGAAAMLTRLYQDLKFKESQRKVN